MYSYYLIHGRESYEILPEDISESHFTESHFELIIKLRGLQVIVLRTYGAYCDWRDRSERNHWLNKGEEKMYVFATYMGETRLGIIDEDMLDESYFENGAKVVMTDTADSSDTTFKEYSEYCTWKKGKVSNAVSPKHYKGYVDEYQWLDTMSRIPTLRDPAKFEAAVEMQIRKYLDRNGQKDNTLQELRKSLFYMKYLVAYKAKGRPITVEEVDGILEALE